MSSINPYNMFEISHNFLKFGKNIIQKSMDTYFASHIRSHQENILNDYHYILNQKNIKTVLDALPYHVMLLDHNRQVVFLNKSVLTLLNIKPSESIGKRPGELIKCIHANEMKYGCGTSKYCNYCGAGNAIVQSQTSDTMVTEDCRIISSDGDQWTSYEFSVSSYNLTVGEKIFSLFTMEDISDTKRRLILEKIFFHDLINSAGSLMGVYELLRESAGKDKQIELLDIASHLSREIVEEILSQRQILQAENNELIPEQRSNNSIKLMNSVVTRMTHHKVSTGKTITIDKNSDDVDFLTDRRIIRRVLINMAKNALEATEKGGEVSIKAKLDGQNIIFSVSNAGFIPEHIQLQIFQRSFSTKGNNRGLGTYSMKLLTEKFLKGKIYFDSTQEKGTTFHCVIPISG